MYCTVKSKRRKECVKCQEKGFEIAVGKPGVGIWGGVLKTLPCLSLSILTFDIIDEGDGIKSHEVLHKERPHNFLKVCLCYTTKSLPQVNVLNPSSM